MRAITFRLLFVVIVLSGGLLGTYSAIGSSPISVTFAHPVVSPGSTQVVMVAADPHLSVEGILTYPNGDISALQGVTDDSGRLTWRYFQPPSTITPHGRTASLTVYSTEFTAAPSAAATYTVGFGPIDLSAEPRNPYPGTTVRIWVHTAPNTKVSIVVRNGETVIQRSQVRTSRSRWAAGTYTLPQVPGFSGYTVSARAVVRGRHLAATTTFTIPTGAYNQFHIACPEVFRHGEAGWEPVDHIILGEEARVEVPFSAVEEAGVWVPSGVTGTLRLSRNGTSIYETQLMQGVPPDDPSAVYATVLLTDPSDVGQLSAEIAVWSVSLSCPLLVAGP